MHRTLVFPEMYGLSAEVLLVLQHQFKVLLLPGVCDASLLEIAACVVEWAVNNL